MKAFDLYNPTTVDGAVELLQQHGAASGHAKALAGGQDLLTELKVHLAEPSAVVNLKHIPNLDRLDHDDRRGLRIGALVNVADVAESAVVRRHFPALAEAAESVGSPQIRHVGTMGGNLCQRPRCWYYRNEHVICLKKGGDTCYAAAGLNKYNAIIGGGPSFIVHPSDTATALAALGASVTIAGRRGQRTIPISEFFTLPTVDVRRENVLAPGEIVTAILVPSSPIAARSAYLKFRERSSMDWALSAAAVAIHIENGRVTESRVVLGGVAPIPWRATHAEARLRGRPLDDATIAAAGEAALTGAVALEHNAYKIPLTKTMVRRAIRQAAGLA